MTSLSIFFGILAALLIGAMSPGPSFVLVCRLSISNSRRSGVAAAIGMGVGGAAFALLSLFGLVAILQKVEWLFWLLKVCGGVYLVYLGVKIWRSAAQPLPLGSARNEETPISLPRPRFSKDVGSFRTGLLTQLANPKTAVVYASIFAALLPSSPSQFLIFALPIATFFVEAGWYTLVAVLFALPAPQRAYLRGKRWIDRAAGSVLCLLGTRLIVEDL